VLRNDPPTRRTYRPRQCDQALGRVADRSSGFDRSRRRGL